MKSKFNITCFVKRIIILKMTHFKITFIGSSGVGKTSIFDSLFNKGMNNVWPTIEPSTQTKTFHLGKNEIKLKFIDLSGSGRFRPISRGYFKNSDAIILIFDLTNRKTFNNLRKWIEEIRILCDSKTFILLIGNKKDLNERRQIRKTEAKKIAFQFDLKYEEVCSFHTKETKAIIQEFLTKYVQDYFREGLSKG
jgi:Ras-related protein Rab-6A